MNILLTNDDGITAPGLWAAAHALAPLGRVLIIAPNENYSGYGMALPPRKQLPLIHYEDVPADLPDVIAFALPAPPAVCVQVGLSGVLSKRPIDLVVSGINDAANLGRDVLYSGTVGAALTAHLRGVPALAASLAAGPAGVAHWATAIWAVQTAAEHWPGRDETPPTLLNLNVPNLPLAEVTGNEMTSLSCASCLDAYRLSVRGENLLHFERNVDYRPPIGKPGSDAWAVAHGSVSLTPLRLFPDVLCGAQWGGSWALADIQPDCRATV